MSEYNDVCSDCGSGGDFKGNEPVGGPSVGAGAPRYVEHWECPDCGNRWSA